VTGVINIAGREIGAQFEPYIICELSANHNGSIERALKMIDAAAATGADAIKIQTYTADTLTIDCDRDDFKIKGGLWDGRILYDLYREAYTPYEWHEKLFARARELGMVMFSTPFDESAVDLLATLDAPAYKIASFEAIDLPLIAYAAKRGKPLIISTGMATLGEIGEAAQAARDNGASGVALLHCVSSYPAPVHDANVATVPHLAAAFGCVAGLSDHTPGIAASVASIALGGAIIEKHFTLSRADGGPDAAFSLEPAEFKRLVDDCKDARRAIGRVNYELLGSERGNKIFRRSLYAVAPIAKGEKLTVNNVRSIRPGNGLAPKHYSRIVGRAVASHDLARGEPLSWDKIKLE
jgi:N-acetylneuraminate synthase